MTQNQRPGGRWQKWATIGIDSYGSRHIVNFEGAIVYVVTASGQLEHGEKLSEKNATVEQWMAFIDDRRGWDRRNYGRGFGAMLSNGEGGAA